MSTTGKKRISWLRWSVIVRGTIRNFSSRYDEKGYLNVRVDGELKEIFHGMKLDRYKMHSIEVVIDKMIVSEADERRLKESLKIAMKQGDGLVLILDAETNEVSPL